MIHLTVWNVGDFLFFSAKRSAGIREALVKALTWPGMMLPKAPDFSDRELLTAIRVLERAVAGAPLHGAEHSAMIGLRHWVLTFLRSRNFPLLKPHVVERSALILETLAAFSGVDFEPLRAPLSHYGEPLKELRKSFRQQPQRPQPQAPHRGRKFSEQSQRQIAAVYLLLSCRVGLGRAAHQTRDALRQWETQLGEKTQRHRLERLVAHYDRAHEAQWKPKARPDAFIAPGNLPRHWLDILGGYLIDRNVRGNPPAFLAPLLDDSLRGERTRVKLLWAAQSQAKAKHVPACGHAAGAGAVTKGTPGGERSASRRRPSKSKT